MLHCKLWCGFFHGFTEDAKRRVAHGNIVNCCSHEPETHCPSKMAVTRLSPTIQPTIYVQLFCRSLALQKTHCFLALVMDSACCFCLGFGHASLNVPGACKCSGARSWSSLLWVESRGKTDRTDSCAYKQCDRGLGISIHLHASHPSSPQSTAHKGGCISRSPRMSPSPLVLSALGYSGKWCSCGQLGTTEIVWECGWHMLEE